MELNEHTKGIKRELASYASDRKSEVSKGCETPRFSALLVQKFGYGMWKMADAASERKLSGELLELTDSLVADIDPEWSDNAKLRWEMSYVDYCETGKAARRDSDSSFALEPSTRDESNTWTPGGTD